MSLTSTRVFAVLFPLIHGCVTEQRACGITVICPEAHSQQRTANDNLAAAPWNAWTHFDVPSHQAFGKRRQKRSHDTHSSDRTNTDRSKSNNGLNSLLFFFFCPPQRRVLVRFLIAFTVWNPPSLFFTPSASWAAEVCNRWWWCRRLQRRAEKQCGQKKRLSWRAVNHDREIGTATLPD